MTRRHPGARASWPQLMPFSTSLANLLTLALFASAASAQPPLAQAAIRGRVIDRATAAPIVGATVEIRPPAGPARWQGQTDADGRFTWAEATEGRYVLTARAEGYLETKQEIAVQGREDVAVEVTLCAPPIVRGRVLRPDGTPLAKSPVLLTITVWTSENTCTVPTPQVTTDAQGRFELRADWLGRWELSAVAPGAGWATCPPFVVQVGETPAEITLKLKPTFSISGRVTIKGTDDPVAGARIDYNPFGGLGFSHAQTDAQGRFALPDLVPAKHGLFAIREGLLHGFVEVELTGEKDVTDIVIEMRRPHTVRGLVLGPDGATPIPNAKIRMNNGYELEADPQGRFALEKMPAGKAGLTAWADGFAPEAADLEVLDDRETPEVKVIFRHRGGSIAGTVLDVEHNRPLSGETVIALPDEEFRVWLLPFVDLWRLQDFRTFQWRGQKPFETQTDADGHYLLPQLSGKTYTVCLLPKRGSNVWQTGVVVKEGQPTAGVNLDFHLHSPGCLTGILRRADGAPLANASAMLDYRSPKMDWGGGLVTDGEGRYYLRLSGEGKSTLTVSLAGFAPVTHEVEFRQGVPLPDLDFVFEPAVPEGEPTCALAGRVFRPDGQTPAEGVWVAAYTGDVALQTNLATQTGPDGAFEVAGLRPGRYGVLATPDPGRFKMNWLTPPDLAGLGPAMTDPVALKVGERKGDLRIVLPQCASISGVVRNAETKEPVPDATVWPHCFDVKPLLLGDLMWPIRTDRAGKFRLSGLLAGTYRLTVSGQNNVLDLPPITLKPGEDLTVDVDLPAKP